MSEKTESLSLLHEVRLQKSCTFVLKMMGRKHFLPPLDRFLHANLIHLLGSHQINANTDFFKKLF